METNIKPFVVKVPTNYIPSVNQMFSGRTKHLSEVASTYKSNIYDLLQGLNLTDNEFRKIYGWIYEAWYLKLEIHFLLNSNFYKRDTDNMIKFSQDILFEWLGINDTYVTSIIGRKFYIPSSECEYVIFILNLDDSDINIYEEKLNKK